MDIKRNARIESLAPFAPRLRAGLANANNRKVSTIWVGSSTTAGTGAGHFTTRYMNVAAGVLQAKFNSSSVTAGLHCFPDDDGWASGGSGTVTQIGRGLGLRSKTLTAGATLTRTFTNCTGWELHYSQGPDQGEFTYTVDGGSPQTVTPDTTGVYRHDGMTITGSISRGSHTLVITATGTFEFNGCYAFDGDRNTGFRAYNSGTGGATAATFINVNSYTLLERADVIPDLAGIVYMVGANDWNINVNPATYEANIETFYNNAEAVLTTQKPDYILVNTYARYDTLNPTYPWARYGQAMANLARRLPRVYYMDLHPYFPTANTAAADPEDMMGSDNTHMNQAGHYYMGQLIAQKIITY